MKVRVTIFTGDDPLLDGDNQYCLSLYKIIPDKDLERAQIDLAEMIANTMAAELIVEKRIRNGVKKRIRDG